MEIPFHFHHKIITTSDIIKPKSFRMQLECDINIKEVLENA